jgi:hypothetical protein
MSSHASGPFRVKLLPQAATDGFGDLGISRLAIDKQFQGDLEAASKGEMLAFRTEVGGSAGYVAMERVDGTLNGRKGGFTLQHSGTMNRGVPHLSVTVVPDSGTGELAGLVGSMTIDNSGGEHFYSFEFSLLDAD